MKTFQMQDMVKGWFVGDFEPTAFKTDQFEVGCKSYKAGTLEARHVHRIATELTMIVSGRVRINENEHGAGAIVVIEPGESSEFEALEDTITVVVKSPSATDDKYLVDK